MRANTTTSTSRPRPKAWLGVLALAFAVCSLLAPSTAGAQYSSAFSNTGGSSESSQPLGGSDYSSVNAIMGAERTPGTAESESGTSKAGPSQAFGPGYSSPSSITGPLSSEPTLVSGSPGNADDGFDWLSAAIGSAAAIALVALGGAAFLTLRRRTAVSTASTS